MPLCSLDVEVEELVRKDDNEGISIPKFHFGQDVAWCDHCSVVNDSIRIVNDVNIQKILQIYILCHTTCTT